MSKKRKILLSSSPLKLLSSTSEEAVSKCNSSSRSQMIKRMTRQRSRVPSRRTWGE